MFKKLFYKIFDYKLPGIIKRSLIILSIFLYIYIIPIIIPFFKSSITYESSVSFHITTAFISIAVILLALLAISIIVAMLYWFITGNDPIERFLF